MPSDALAHSIFIGLPSTYFWWTLERRNLSIYREYDINLRRRRPAEALSVCETIWAGCCDFYGRGFVFRRFIAPSGLQKLGTVYQE